MTRNYVFQAGYFSLHSLSRLLEVPDERENPYYLFQTNQRSDNIKSIHQCCAQSVWMDVISKSGFSQTR